MNPSCKIFFFICGISAWSLACTPRSNTCESAAQPYPRIQVDSITQVENLEFSYFSGPDITPSPACIATAPTGAVFVGVDMMGSLGKAPGKGKIVRLMDCNHDGIADSHTVFAEVDNPRGLLPIGDKLYVLHTVFSKKEKKALGMDLVVFFDSDKDGIADGPSIPLIQNISSPKFLQGRGTDHSTNGIRMGIDGWIYIAVGDFGFHGAYDRSSRIMTMLGGGIIRVRPDGTEMEVYTHGMRNIYDMAIDPYLNIFTRGNTNDGGGWNVRFVHHIQSGEYGYPVLFKHFTDEILPALEDLGGGSGTGALYMDEPGWPSNFNQTPLMADWGRNRIISHPTSADGASFTQKQADFIEVPQVTDLDVDGSGRMYISAWDGAGYRGSPDKGFVLRAVPSGWSYKQFPNLAEISLRKLGKLLRSPSAVARLHAQQELLNRPKEKTAPLAWKIATDRDLPLAARVAGIFTYAQIAKEAGINNLVTLSNEEEVQEFALRALADRLHVAKKVPLDPFYKALESNDPRVQATAIIGLGRIGKKEAIGRLLKVPVPSSAIAPANGTEGLHASPNSEIIHPHLAVRSLHALGAVEECVQAVDGPHADLALWALRYMHHPKVVSGLIDAFNSTERPGIRTQILSTLARLYKREAPYDGSWWWSTRPDTHGPYYKAITWSESETIKKFLLGQWNRPNNFDKNFFADLNSRYRMGIQEFGGTEDILALNENTINLGRIANKKGEVGRASIEDLILAVGDISGDPAIGAEIFERQGCIACHSLKKGEAMKGPFMGQIGSIMNRDQIAEAILTPNASISQGFASYLIKTQDNKSYVGFISEESAEKIVMRNIAGNVFTIATDNVLSRQELEVSMMPKGLANSLSFEEFASLITFLSQQKE